MASRGSSANPAGKGEAVAEAEAPAPAPRRKAPAARKTRGAVRGADAGSGSGSAAVPIEIAGEEEEDQEEGDFVTSDAEGGEARALPSTRRDRSPPRRGAGRPDRWADRGAGGAGGGGPTARKPSSPLSSPLRPITNYTSEGDRPPRTKAKVRRRLFALRGCCCVRCEVAYGGWLLPGGED